MNILTICGSHRKGNSYAVLQAIEKYFPEIHFTLLMLNDMNLKMCKGCCGCVLNGEDALPLKEDSKKGGRARQ
jgi:multimeric flavodoxin WrbA